MGRWGRSPAHSFWQICTSVFMWMDPQAAPESTCPDPHPTTHGAHPPTSHWGGLIKPGQLTSVHTVARLPFCSVLNLNHIVCEMNQTYIHSSRPCENHETSPCVGKAAFWVGEVDNLGREGESLMLHSRPPYMHRCFYLDAGIWGCTQKLWGACNLYLFYHWPWCP